MKLALLTLVLLTLTPLGAFAASNCANYATLDQVQQAIKKIDADPLDPATADAQQELAECGARAVSVALKQDLSSGNMAETVTFVLAKLINYDNGAVFDPLLEASTQYRNAYKGKIGKPLHQALAQLVKSGRVTSEEREALLTTY